MKYILTYKDAQEICQKYNSNNFWEFTFTKDGYKLAAFNYFICGWNDFANPLPNRPEVNAFDLRGVTFVFNKDGSLWKTFFMLPKFFNLNQVDSTQYGVVKDKEICSITEKADGSLIAFMMLPNGKLFAKTIGSFTSEQSELAYNLLYTNEEHVIWVKELLNAGYTPLFEYVSWDNRVVLKYSKPQIRFIGMRDNITGIYYSVSEINKSFIPKDMQVVEEESGTLDSLIEESKTAEGKEGWVIKFTDDQLIKLKTAWYFIKHKCKDDAERENIIIKMILDETIDDLLSQLEDEEFRNQIKHIQEIVMNYFYKKSLEVEKLCKLYKGDRKEFVLKFKSNPNFSFAIQHIFNNKDIRISIKEYLEKRTHKLNNAREFIDKGCI
jgi:T4 RnlA family RNA ligase